jgi:hypothetical protein
LVFIAAYEVEAELAGGSQTARKDEAAELEHSSSDMNIFFLTELRRIEKSALPALSETADTLLTFSPDDEETCREMREVEKRRKLQGLPPMVQFLMPDPDAEPENPDSDAPDQPQAEAPAPSATATG